MRDYVDISEFVGKTFTTIRGMEPGSEEIIGRVA